MNKKTANIDVLYIYVYYQKHELRKGGYNKLKKVQNDTDCRKLRELNDAWKMYSSEEMLISEPEKKPK